LRLKILTKSRRASLISKLLVLTKKSVVDSQVFSVTFLVEVELIFFRVLKVLADEI